MTNPSLTEAGRAQPDPVHMPTERECPFDPPNSLGRLRDSQPLSRLRFPDGHIGWLVTSHALARTVLGDPRFSMVPAGPPNSHPEGQAAKLFEAIQRDAAFPDPVRSLVDRYQQEGRLTEAFRDPEVVRALHEHPLSKLSFFFMDPPHHSRIRRLLAPHFTVRRAAEQRTRIEQIVADCLDDMERVGPPVDLVETFARRIPSLMTCALFGMPDSEASTFERLAGVRHTSTPTVEELREADDEFRIFARELVEHKRAEPGDDLLSTLVDGGKMTDDELAAAAVSLVSAAHSTTALTISFGVLTLLRDRDRWDVLRNRSAPIGRIVEELLRYTTADQAPDVRTALEDVEVGGTVIKAFDNVVVALPAVNRDPQVFTDPDRVDLTRHAAHHLSFGYGVHQCIGQHFARLELEIALTGLANRFPTLDLAVPMADIAWHSGDRQLYGPRQLPVTW